MSQQQKENEAKVEKPKLWELCRDGEAKKLEKALRKASPSLLSKRWGPGKKTCLMWAVLAKGRQGEATVKALLNKPGVDVNARQGGGGGLTALHLAATHSSSEVVLALLKVDGVKVLGLDKEGHTALERATKAGQNKKVLQELAAMQREEFEGEKQKNEEGRNVKNPAEPILDQDNDVVMADADEKIKEEEDEVILEENKSLWNSCRNGDVVEVRESLARGADVNACMNNFPCLVVAVLFQNEEVVDLLLAHPDIQVNQRDHLGGTALHATSAGTSVSLVKKILNHPGVDFEARDKLDKTPLMRGVEQGTVEVVKAMVEQMGLQMNLRDKFGLNVWDIAKNRERSEFGTSNTGSDMLALIFAVQGQNGVTGVLGEIMRLGGDLDKMETELWTTLETRSGLTIIKEDEGEVEEDHQEGGLVEVLKSREEEKAEMERRHSERLNQALQRQERRREALTREERETLDQVAAAAEQMEVELKVEMEERLERVRREFEAKIGELKADKEEKDKSITREVKKKMEELVKSDEVEVERILEENEHENAEMVSRHLDEDENAQGESSDDDENEGYETARETPNEDENEVSMGSQTSYAPECPVCYESMAPPVHIYQCARGHLVCGNCRPQIEECPSRLISFDCCLFFLQHGVFILFFLQMWVVNLLFFQPGVDGLCWRIVPLAPRLFLLAECPGARNKQHSKLLFPM